MFKKNYDHLPKDTYFGMYKEATRTNPNYFLTYGNGKAAARIQDHLRPNGAHRWHNYMKTPKYGFTLSLCVACLSCLLYSNMPFNVFVDNQTIQFSDNSLLPPFSITITYSICSKWKRAFDQL